MTAGVLLFTNNAGSTLAGAITNTATLLNVATGGGALFPSPGAGQYFKLTVIDAATGLLTEFMHVTNVTGDQFTVVRAQEGSTALAWSAGDLVELTTTAGTLAAMAQQAQLQSNSTNYSTDSGAANALVGALSPVPVSLASLTGAPISIKVAASNTGAATLNLNSLGVTGIVNGDGSALSGGQLLAGQIIEVAYNGAYFQLLGPKTPSATVPLFSTVSIKSTNYTLTTGDSGALIDAGAVAITLIAAPFVGYATSIISNATGTTILPNGNTVNLASGATSSTISLPAAGDFVTLVWDGSVWRVVGGSVAMLNAGASAAGYNRGIKIQVTSSTAISVAASTLAVSNAAGVVLPISALSTTIATGTTGLGGLDTGTIAASTVYYVYAVSNGTTSGTVISTSSANPASAITTTYPYYLRIGSVRTNASSLLLGTLQVGRTVRYVIGGPNVSSMPQMASAGTSGGALTAISVASYVPPNASKIGLLLAFSGTGSPSAVYAAAAPNGNYSTPSGYNSTPMWLGCTAIASAGAISSDMLLESSSVYYASNYGTTGLFCLGWEENI